MPWYIIFTVFILTIYIACNLGSVVVDYQHRKYLWVPTETGVKCYFIGRQDSLSGSPTHYFDWYLCSITVVVSDAHELSHRRQSYRTDSKIDHKKVLKMEYAIKARKTCKNQALMETYYRSMIDKTFQASYI